jgi:hypothetical protein
VIICIIAVVPATVGTWGILTLEHGRQLNEMDGMINYIALWLALLLGCVGVSLMLIARWQRNRPRRGFPLD